MMIAPTLSEANIRAEVPIVGKEARVVEEVEIGNEELRQANAALYRIVLCRLRWDLRTRAYALRRKDSRPDSTRDRG